MPDGEVGELVLTTLRKQGAPLIRYRTHDLTRIIPGDCACGLKHPRIDTLTGRTDDMFKVKGCNIFPAQVEEVIAATGGTSSEYQVIIENISGKDVLTVLFYKTRSKTRPRSARRRSWPSSSRRSAAAPPTPSASPWANSRAARRKRSASSTAGTKNPQGGRAKIPARPPQICAGWGCSTVVEYAHAFCEGTYHD